MGTAISELRKKAGLSLREVERRSGGHIRSSHLSQVETGKIAEPSLSFLRELAGVFGWTFAGLLRFLKIIDPDRAGDLTSEQRLVLTYFTEFDPELRQQALEYMGLMAKWRPSRPDERQGPSRQTPANDGGT